MCEHLRCRPVVGQVADLAYICAKSDTHETVAGEFLDLSLFAAPDGGTTMSRSVVLAKTPRCARCQFPPRWCICAGFAEIDCPLHIDVLIHHREYWRPTSTGRLINRVMPSSRGHVFRHDLPLTKAAIARPGRTLWILHPLGEPVPAGETPEALQVLLLDGSWREAARMMHGVEGWGRLVSLPMTGPSRYLLRDQQGTGRYSTAEALLFLLASLGLASAHARFRLQFELHVYAGLRARGEKAAAEAFLAGSPVREAFPELLRKLAERRPQVGTDFQAVRCNSANK